MSSSPKISTSAPASDEDKVQPDSESMNTEVIPDKTSSEFIKTQLIQDKTSSESIKTQVIPDKTSSESTTSLKVKLKITKHKEGKSKLPFTLLNSFTNSNI